jgi:hypothetical protein
MSETKISSTSEMEALPSLCEIRFDCYVKMYELGHRVIKTGFLAMDEKAVSPQWFKSEMKITLESIRCGDEYSLGRQLKIMLMQ